MVRLVTGCSWDVAARLSPAGETTLRNRRTEWLRAGVFNRLVEEAIAGDDKIIGLDLSEVAVDGSLHKAPCGGEGTGPNPTDRAKIGGKWSVATDLFGIPIGWGIDGAHRNDSIFLETTLQAVADRGLILDVETLHLDRGYDSNLTTERCEALGLTDVVCAKKRRKGEAKIKKPLTLGLRCYGGGFGTMPATAGDFLRSQARRRDLWIDDRRLEPGRSEGAAHHCRTDRTGQGLHPG